MRKLMQAGWFGMALLVGCGGGGGSAPSAPPVIPPAVLTGLQVLPGSGTLDIGDSLALSAQGLYSDGSKKAVAAVWASTAPAIVAVSGGPASVCVAQGQDEGSATVQASFEGFSASAKLDVVDTIPTDPGPFYGSMESGEVLQYPVGGGDPIVVATPDWFSNGFVLNRAGTALYVVGTSLFRVDLDTFAVTPIGTLPAGEGWLLGLAEEASGTLISHSYGTGEVVRIDPVTGTLTPVAACPVMSVGNAVGPDGALYTTAILGGQITRTNLVTGASATWAFAPAVVTSGLAVNRRGEAFTGDVLGPNVLRCVDLNGDGDAMDPGEESVFASVVGDANFGFAIAGGGSVLVNNQAYGLGTGTPGVYWLRDLNRDGDASDADEATLWNSMSTYNGLDGGCLAAPR